jgi:hypothetical protein
MNTVEFFKYITTPLTIEEMTMLYKAYNIQYDKCCLFYDFISSLNFYIVDTFLGDDVINEDEDKKNHYNWCFNKVLTDFKEEGIHFTYNDDLNYYFYNFYFELFYNDLEKENPLEKLNKLPKYSFDYRKIKTRSDLDVLIELYKLFDKSLKNKIKT